jgi:hypothetical protein
MRSLTSDGCAVLANTRGVLSLPMWILPSVPPKPGDAYPCGPYVQEARGRCWRMVHSKQLQATHCNEPVAWTGLFTSPSGKRQWKVRACEVHTDGLSDVSRL